MLKHLSNSNLIRGNAIVGISITLMDNGNLHIDGCILVKKKDEVEIKSNFHVENIKDLSQHISIDLPIILHIDGKGIIHKKTDSETIDLRKIFPGADLSNFYVDEHKISDSIYIKSIVRKEAIDNLTQAIFNLGYFIRSVSFGPHSLFYLRNLIEIFPGEICTRKQKYVVSSNGELNIHPIKNEETEIVQIGSEQLMEHEILPYLSALKFFIKPGYNVVENNNLPKLNWDNFLYKKVFGYVRWSMLGFFFLILLFNYFIFDSIGNKITDLQTETQSNNQILQELKKLSKEFELKEKMVQESGLSSQTRFSLLSDKIGSSVPQHITLSSVVFAPIKEQIREGEEILFEKSTVIIEGTARNSLELNEWLKKLREEEWIEKIDILKYEHDYNNKFGDFRIRIKIKA